MFDLSAHCPLPRSPLLIVNFICSFLSSFFASIESSYTYSNIAPSCPRGLRGFAEITQAALPKWWNWILAYLFQRFIQQSHKSYEIAFSPFSPTRTMNQWLFKKYYKRLKDFPAAQCNHKDAPNRFRSHISVFIDFVVVAKRCYGMRYKMKSFQIRTKGWGKWISSLLRINDQGMLSSCGLRKSWDCCDEDAGGWNSITNVKESPLLSPSSLSCVPNT